MEAVLNSPAYWRKKLVALHPFLLAKKPWRFLPKLGDLRRQIAERPWEAQGNIFVRCPDLAIYKLERSIIACRVSRPAQALQMQKFVVALKAFTSSRRSREAERAAAIEYPDYDWLREAE